MLNSRKFFYSATLGVVFSILLVGCNSGSEKVALDNPEQSKKILKRIQTVSQLESNLKKLMLQTYGKITPIFYTLEGDNLAVPNIDAAASSTTSSSTNIQVNGVDEADRIKNDASYLYIASSYKSDIKAYATATGDAVLSDQVNLRPDGTISGLYLFNKKLIALSSNNNIYNYYANWFDVNQWNGHATQLDLLQTADGKMTKESKLKIDGQLISSRRIADTLYLVMRHTPSLDGLILYPSTDEEVANNIALINAASLSDLLPDYAVNESNKGDILAASRCFNIDYADNSQQQATIINVLSIDLNNITARPKGSCFIGDAEALYVSTDALYLATTQYNYEITDGFAFYPPKMSTDIHKFSLDGLDINYKGSAQVLGHLGWQQDLKAFRMGEFSSFAPSVSDAEAKSIFGIITYTGNQANTVLSPARLTLLQEDETKAESLKIVAQLPNEKHPESLGKPGEQIYATRFIGSKAYLVTFRTTDPLYIVDMSDPTDPFVAGELQIDGYSDYLHPIGENYLLGIGKDAIEDSNSVGDSRGAWYQGVKLSLIDISNPQAPTEIWQEIIGKRGTETTVSNTHHGITTLQQGDNLKIALPISLHDFDKESYDEELDKPIPMDTPNTYYQWQYDGLYQYNINTQTGALTPLQIIKAPVVDEQNDLFVRTVQYDRSAFISGRTYYLHGDEIISGN